MNPSAESIQSAAQPNSQALLYVSEPVLNRVRIYTFPGLRPRGSLRGLYRAEGLCVDGITGNVWVVEPAFANKVVEFAHGSTTPIRTLKIPSALYPQGCAVDSTTGDLAVTAQIAGDDPGGIVIYRHARKSETEYQSRKMFYYDFVAYDGNGNAFVDGNGDRHNLAELPADTKSLKIVPVGGLRIQRPGGIQYDGANVAIGAERNGTIYQVSNGMIAGTTTLRSTCNVQQFSIYQGQVIAPNICGNKGEVLVYNYPAGGAPVKKLGGLSYPFAAIISP